jgi:hypothetical protein
MKNLDRINSLIYIEITRTPTANKGYEISRLVGGFGNVITLF